MKKLLPILFLIILPVFAETDSYGINYCNSETDYDCRIKNNNECNLYWYQIKEKRWKNKNGRYVLADDIVKLGFEKPHYNNINIEDLYIQRFQSGEYNMNNFYMWREFVFEKK